MKTESKVRPVVIACIVLVSLAATTLAVSWGLFVYQFGMSLASESSQWGIFGDFIGGFVGTLLAALTLGAVAYTMYQQAMHVEEQQRQTREIFLSTQRPWVMVRNAELAGQVRISPQGIDVTLRLGLKNVGNAPALWALAIPRLLLKTESIDPLSEARALIRKHKESRARADTALGQTLFPGVEQVSQIKFGLSATEVPDATQSGPSLLAYIILHITYAVAFDGGRRHLTAMLFEIRRRPRTASTEHAILDVDAGNIASTELDLVAYPIGDYAD